MDSWWCRRCANRARASSCWASAARRTRSTRPSAVRVRIRVRVRVRVRPLLQV